MQPWIRRSVAVAAAAATTLAAALTTAGPARAAANPCESYVFPAQVSQMALDTDYADLEPGWVQSLGYCFDQTWTLSIPDLGIAVDNQHYEDFAYLQPISSRPAGGPEGPNNFYLSNDQVGIHDVIIKIGTDAPKTYRHAFTITRATYWKYVNAGPEPAALGSTITVRGRLKRADWDAGTNVEYAGSGVQVLFHAGRTQAPVSAATVVATGHADVTGFVSVPVTVTQQGRWYLGFLGDSTSGGSETQYGDLVPVS